MTGLAGLDVDAFLRDHWQKSPLLIRGAVQNFENPLSAEELAGLALEDDIEARLVTRDEQGWHLDQGPFDEQSFSLESPWTLLVQSVDLLVPEVAGLRELVDFLPRWRLDDVMVSYATDGGGVGPHYDNYDVFLLQGLGRRRWQIGQACDATTPIDISSGQKILTGFEQQAEYLLEPGDILYVPPGVAHWGTAVGSCMTYSIGLRAPRVRDMLSRWVDALLEELSADMFYRDPAATQRARPGEISDSIAQSAVRQLRDAIGNHQLSADWFGELVTEPKQDFMVADDPGELPDRVSLELAAGLAWRKTPEGIIVYANGESFCSPGDCLDTLQRLCCDHVVAVGDLGSAARELVLELWQRGCLRDE